MSLPVGTKLIRSRKTGVYILGVDGTIAAGDPVKTIKVEKGTPVPAQARIDVAADGTSYTLKSGSLYIGASGSQNAQGQNYLIWKDAAFKWEIKAIEDPRGFWNIIDKNQYAGLNLVPSSGQPDSNINYEIVVLLADKTLCQSHWEFKSSG